jgi:ABC-type phosphate/phosphonate transport system substrate-binding protein
MIVASSTLDKEIFLKIQNALLEAQNIENFSGFEARRDSEYNHLRVIMKEVDETKKRNEE